MKALLSTAPLVQAHWLEGLLPDPPLLDSTLFSDLLAELTTQGVEEIGAPPEDLLLSACSTDVRPFTELSIGESEPVLVVAFSGPFRFDLAGMLADFRAHGADCHTALIPRGARSSLPRVAVDPSGRPELLQPHDHPEPVGNLRDSGIRIARGALAHEVLSAGIRALTGPADTTMTTDSTSCTWQRDLLSPESFLLCCHELLTGRAGCWRGPSGDAPGSVIDPTARSESPPEGNVWLAERVEVGKNTVLRRSVLLPGARVGNRCDLDSVLVLPGASVGSGTDMSDKYLNVIGLEGG